MHWETFSLTVLETSTVVEHGRSQTTDTPGNHIKGKHVYYKRYVWQARRLSLDRKCTIYFYPVLFFLDAALFHPVVFIVPPVLILMIILGIVYRCKCHKVTSKFCCTNALKAYTHRQTNCETISYAVRFKELKLTWTETEPSQQKKRKM